MSQPLNSHSTSNVLAEVPGVGILIAHGSAKPADGAEGYAPGCIFFLTGGTDLTNVQAVNHGTKAVADFDIVTFTATS